jgi:hypothetical protein
MTVTAGWPHTSQGLGSSITTLMASSASFPGFPFRSPSTVSAGFVGRLLRPFLTGRSRRSHCRRGRLRLELVPDGGRLNRTCLGQHPLCLRKQQLLCVDDGVEGGHPCRSVGRPIRHHVDGHPRYMCAEYAPRCLPNASALPRSPGTSWDWEACSLFALRVSWALARDLRG